MRIFLSFFFLCTLTSCLQQSRPVTPQEALAFGKRLEGDVARQRNIPFDSVVNIETLAQRVTGSGSAISVKKFASEMKRGMTTTFTEMLKSGSSAAPDYKLLRQYETGGVQHLLFRLLAEGGMNYHDIELVKMDNRVQAGDFYIYTTCENFSQTLKSLMPVLGDGKKSSSNELLLKRITTLNNAGQHDEALKILKSAPPEIQNNKAMAALRLQLGAAVGGDEFQSALQDFERRFGHDPTTKLMLVDGYLVQGEYAKTLACINSLDSAVRGDPYLDLMRANVYGQSGDEKEQLRHMEKAYKAMPDIPDIALSMIVTYLTNKKMNEAKTTIQQFKLSKKYKAQELNEVLAQFSSDIRSSLGE